jgi:hypothetical protein
VPQPRVKRKRGHLDLGGMGKDRHPRPRARVSGETAKAQGNGERREPPDPREGGEGRNARTQGKGIEKSWVIIVGTKFHCRPAHWLRIPRG